MTYELLSKYATYTTKMMVAPSWYKWDEWRWDSLKC